MRSGREMFELDPSLFVDEEDVLNADELEPEDDRDEVIKLIFTVFT
jgi:hypothetical protein